MDFIISLKDGSYYRITKEEANTLFNAWTNKQDVIVIPRGVSVSHTLIKMVTDLDHWIRHENMTLKNRRQARCQSCLNVKEISLLCPCREKDRPMEYNYKYTQGKGAQGIIDSIKPKRNVSKDKVIKAYELLVDNFEWCKNWSQKSESGKRSVLNYAKVVASIGFFTVGNKKISV